MACHCKVAESLLALVVLVFAFLTVSWGKWVIAVAALALLVHALMCKHHNK